MVPFTVIRFNLFGNDNAIAQYSLNIVNNGFKLDIGRNIAKGPADIQFQQVDLLYRTW